MIKNQLIMLTYSSKESKQMDFWELLRLSRIIQMTRVQAPFPIRRIWCKCNSILAPSAEALPLELESSKLLEAK